MDLRKRALLISVILLAAFLLSEYNISTLGVRAHSHGATFQAWTPTTPTIDGVIDETTEWKHARSRDFSVDGRSGTLYVMNDANNLYLAVKIADTSYDHGAFPNTDGIYFQFDNDNDGTFPEVGDDYIYLSSLTFKDGYLAPSLTQDISDGGTTDGQGAMNGDGTNNYFEISHTLDSTDNAHDFSLLTGETVGFRVYYHESSSGYTGGWPGDTGTTMGDIVVTSPPPTLSGWAYTPPTINGVVDATEWASAATSTLVIGWTYTGTVYVMNDANNLYLAAKIADSSLTGGDRAIFAFDNDNDGEIEAGDDILQLTGDSSFIDVYFLDPMHIAGDTTDGGTADGDGKAGASAGYNYFEFSHPLNSADNAHDFSLSAGQTVGFDVEYIEASGYWGDWPSYTSASWAHITVASAPTIISLSAWAPAPPTIDGVIDPTFEWLDAARSSFAIAGTYTGTFYVMNDASNLYIGIEIADDDLNTGATDDALGLYFDNNNDGTWQDGEDSIALYASIGFKDRFLNGFPVKTYDTDAGGTNDGSGALTASGGKNYFEMSHPLKSADSAHDFQLNLGDTVRFDFGYRDGGVGPATAGYWPVDESTDASGWGRIKIASAAPSVSLSAWTSAPPTINGVIDATEWAGAATTSFSLLDFSGGTTSYTGNLYVMNDANNLYLAIKVADASLSASDTIGFAFDNNNDHSSIAEGDELLYQSGEPLFYDYFWSTASGLKPDTDAGGTTDGSGAVQNSGGFNYFELSHPLNSADDLHDFSLSAGSTVGFGLRYRDDTTMMKRWPTEAQPGWAEIVVASAPVMQDFSVSANPPTLTINQGSASSATITIQSINGFSAAVTFATSWVSATPTDVSPSTPGSVTPIPDGAGTTTVMVTAGASASTGPFTLRVTGTSGSLTHSVDIPITVSAAVTPSCIIATATYGSELSPEVQFLRTFRDAKVMGTFAGRNFMLAFNKVYYSFSPTVAQAISAHEELRGITKILLYPLIGILYISSTTFDALSFAPELAVITTGLVSSALIGLCYLAPLLFVAIRKPGRAGLKNHGKYLVWIATIWTGAMIFMAIAEIAALPTLMMLASATFTLTTIAGSGLGAAMAMRKRFA